MTLYHVLFDGKPEVVGHVCEEHRLMGDAIPCDTDHGDGECDHVQYQVCAEPWHTSGCAACLEDVRRYGCEQVADSPGSWHWEHSAMCRDSWELRI